MYDGSVSWIYDGFIVYSCWIFVGFLLNQKVTLGSGNAVKYWIQMVYVYIQLGVFELNQWICDDFMMDTYDGLMKDYNGLIMDL